MPLLARNAFQVLQRLSKFVLKFIEVLFSGDVNLKINTQNFYSKLELSRIGYNGAYGDTGGWDLDPSIAAIMMKVMDDDVSSNVGFSTGNASGIYALRWHSAGETSL